MPACEEQGFSGVTSEHFASLGGQQHSGQATESGVTIRWEFNQKAGTLKVQCTETPMLLPCGLINAKIKEAVTSVLQKTDTGGAAPLQA
jgi:hypothetical protein